VFDRGLAREVGALVVNEKSVMNAARGVPLLQFARAAAISALDAW
jgi:hypothetical protein